MRVSIHVPARGTTHMENIVINQNVCFNPRSRTGNDSEEEAIEKANEVSIHVPARGTTISSRNNIYHGKFQSTFPHGERPAAFAGWNRRRSCFNPRSRTGNDLFQWGHKLLFVVSIHVPARGTTKDGREVELQNNGFNPRSRTGNDNCRWITQKENCSFNPRSRTGNDALYHTGE